MGNKSTTCNSMPQQIAGKHETKITEKMCQDKKTRNKLKHRTPRKKQENKKKIQIQIKRERSGS